MSNLLNPEEIAKRFNRSLSWFYKNYKRFEKERHFPKPIKFNGYNLQWSAYDVDLWFNTHIDCYKLNDNHPGASYEKLLAANAALL